MNAFLNWFTAPEWSQVIKTLLHSLWQGALIAAGLALLMRRVTNPHQRYRFSLLALILIPTCGVITWAALNPSNARLPVPQVQSVLSNPAPIVTLDENPSVKVILPTGHSPAPSPLPWTAWLAVLWIVGAAIMLSRAGIKLAGAEKLRRSCVPLDNPQLTQLLAEARRAVGLVRRIRVAVTDRLTSPAVVGVLVPTLILPLSLVTTLTPEQIRFILLHELAHIRRGDYLANLFQLFIEAVLFFNPAVWWISHQVRREREACCDALAIQLSGASADYARTLVHVAESILNPAPTAAPAFGDEREPSSLADRVQRLLVPGYRPSLRLTWRAMITAFLVGAILLVLSAEGTRMAVAQISKPSAQTANKKAASTQKNEDTAKTEQQASRTSSQFPSKDWPFGSDLLGSTASRQWTYQRVGDNPNPFRDVAFNLASYNALSRAGTPIISANENSTAMVDSNNQVGMNAWVIEGGQNQLHKQWFWFRTGDGRKVDVDPNQINYQLTAKASQEAIRDLKGNSRDNQPPASESSPSLNRPPVEISAVGANSQVVHNRNTGKSSVTNRGIVRFKDMAVEADSIELDQKTGDLIATGNVRLERPGKTNTAARIEVNIFSNEPPRMLEWPMILTNEKKRALMNKLKGIRLDRVYFNTKPLMPVIAELQWQSFRSDSEGLGVTIGFKNFESDDLAEINVTINPALTNVTLMDALDAVVKGANQPLKLILDESTVSIARKKGDEPSPLFVREIKVDPTLFLQHLAEHGYPLQSVKNTTYTNQIAEQNAQSIRAFLASTGVNLDPMLGKSIFYNDRRGVFLVRATMEELDRVEALLRPLRPQATQASVTTSAPSISSALSLRTFRVDPNTFWKGIESVSGFSPNRTNVNSSVRDFFATLGVNLTPPKSFLFNDRAGELLVRSTKEDLDIIEAALVVLNKEAPQVNIKVRFVEIDMKDRTSAKDLSLLLGIIPTNAVSASKPADKAKSPNDATGDLPLQFTGILTDPQYRVVLRALDQRKGTDVLAMQEVTTLSGRQAQIQCVEMRTVVNGLRLPVQSLPGNSSTNASTNSFYQTQLMPFGPVLDVLPTVSVDGLTIQMTVIPTVTEFLGYDDPGRVPSSLKATNKDPVLPLPRMRVRQMTTNAKVWDGQTLVLGMANDQLISKEAKGGFLKQEYTGSKKQLLVFITPTIIDQAGNRAHADAEMPPARQPPSRK